MESPMQSLPGGYTPGIWEYNYPSPAVVTSFGDETTYVRGLGWLYEECQDVQDWGAGPAYGRRFCPQGKSYLAVDGSPTSAGYSDVVCELTAWQPDPLPEGIFMRHVLEHNEHNWKDILAHALESFTKRFSLVVFTPFTSGETHRLRPVGDLYCDLAFNYGELVTQFGLTGQYRWHTEALPTDTQYGSEVLFYIRKPE